MQPVLADIPREIEEAAACLGAKPLQVFRYILVPALLPAWLTGFALAFARGVGEYGSVIFIAGNMPMKTEILPLLIMVKLPIRLHRRHRHPGAAGAGAVLHCAGGAVHAGRGRAGHRPPANDRDRAQFNWRLPPAGA